MSHGSGGRPPGAPSTCPGASPGRRALAAAAAPGPRSGLNPPAGEMQAQVRHFRVNSAPGHPRAASEQPDPVSLRAAATHRRSSKPPWKQRRRQIEGVDNRHPGESRPRFQNGRSMATFCSQNTSRISPGQVEQQDAHPRARHRAQLAGGDQHADAGNCRCLQRVRLAAPTITCRWRPGAPYEAGWTGSLNRHAASTPQHEGCPAVNCRNPPPGQADTAAVMISMPCVKERLGLSRLASVNGCPFSRAPVAQTQQRHKARACPGASPGLPGLACRPGACGGAALVPR